MKAVKLDNSGWIRAVTQKPEPLPDAWRKVDKTTYDNIEPADPENATEAWHWNSGSPELRETGASPSGEQAYAQMEKYLRDKYTLNEWANMMDANPILIELIKNEEYKNAVDRADYLANDDNSLVNSEDADKLREVTKV